MVWKRRSSATVGEAHNGSVWLDARSVLAVGRIRNLSNKSRASENVRLMKSRSRVQVSVLLDPFQQIGALALEKLEPFR
jgi:hypothetical protein